MLYTPPIKEIQCWITPAGSIVEQAVYPGPQAPVAPLVAAGPLFIATGNGNCYGLVVRTKVLSALNSGTFRLRRSQDFGSTWINLGGASVSCTIPALGTNGSDLVHFGSFVAGDWIIATSQFAAIDFLNGGLRFHYMYTDSN
jgi:hypothetical protein